MCLTQQTADKLGVIEALFRFAAGVDLHDPALLASAFTLNATSDLRPATRKVGFEYPVMEGRNTIVAGVGGSLASLDTTHTVTNTRVTLSGDEAKLDALVEAYHVTREETPRKFVMKNRYDVDLVRESEMWVIAKMVVDNVWREGDLSVMDVI
jgi:septum formation inhibitor-activating ATPase MinD